MTKGKMQTWNVLIAGKHFCTVNAYTRKSARLQAKRMPNLRSGEIYVTPARVSLSTVDWSKPDQLGVWGDTGA